MNRIAELTKQLKKETAEHKEMVHQLDMSLELQKLWPQAFDCGSVKANLVGNYHKPETMIFRILRSDGDIRDYHLIDVPDALLDFHIDRIESDHKYARDAIRDYVRRAKHRRERDG